MPKLVYILIFSILNIISINSDEKRVIRVKDLKSDSYVPIKTNQIFAIELEGNVSTGYSWFLENPEKVKDLGLIRPTNLNEYNEGKFYKRDELYKTEKEPQMLGAPGLFRFDFIASEKTGHEEITFTYKRPWDDSDKKQTTLNLKIVNEKKNKDL